MFPNCRKVLASLFSRNPKADSKQLTFGVISGAPNSCAGLEYPISVVGWKSVLLVLPLLELSQCTEVYSM